MQPFKRHGLLLLLVLMGCVSGAYSAEKKIKVSKRYLNFPITHQTDRKAMRMSVKGKEVCRFVIRLAENEPQYWTFQDVEQWKGQTITLSYDGPAQALDRIVQADSIVGGHDMYNEPQRPRYHFTTRRGWINDPNGLVYLDGKYHLFYQHNPYERDWENMHWGHAVSTDLTHWDELPDALHPDTIGTIFSGSCVVDYGNTAGYNTRDGQPAMVAFYTADHPRYQRQCMAYSTDGGLTFTKYEGNPVIDSHEKWQSHDTRDPKVFWYEPGKHWVLVLNERDGHSIYNSDNLKDWTFKSHITGFWECPELFEVPVEGNPSDKRWVLWGASGTYMVGSFDGQKFTPEGPKRCNLGGSAYAAQVFNNLPGDGTRVVKMAWGRITFDGTPFNGVMLLPQEQMLIRTPYGLRLNSYPARETQSLFKQVYSARALSSDEANEAMKAYAGDDVLRIKATLRLTYATDAGLSYRGQRLVDYDMNGNRLNGLFYTPDEPGSLLLNVDVYVDKGVVEVYADGGAISFSMRRDGNRDEGYVFWGNQLRVEQLEVYRLAE